MQQRADLERRRPMAERQQREAEAEGEAELKREREEMELARKMKEVDLQLRQLDLQAKIDAAATEEVTLAKFVYGTSGSGVSNPGDRGVQSSMVSQSNFYSQHSGDAFASLCHAKPEDVHDKGNTLLMSEHLPRVRLQCGEMFSPKNGDKGPLSGTHQDPRYLSCVGTGTYIKEPHHTMPDVKAQIAETSTLNPLAKKWTAPDRPQEIITNPDEQVLTLSQVAKIMELMSVSQTQQKVVPRNSIDKGSRGHGI